MDLGCSICNWWMNSWGDWFIMASSVKVGNIQGPLHVAPLFSSRLVQACPQGCRSGGFNISRQGRAHVQRVCKRLLVCVCRFPLQTGYMAKPRCKMLISRPPHLQGVIANSHCNRTCTQGRGNLWLALQSTS